MSRLTATDVLAAFHRLAEAGQSEASSSEITLEATQAWIDADRPR
jgi:hypothetical protein